MAQLKSGTTVGGDFTVDTNTLHVDATNNRVGIGTDSPSTALDVAGAISDTDGNVRSGRKNLIINGAMKVAQRGTSFTDPSSGEYTLDRWRAGVHTSTAAANYTQEADAPTAAQAGTNFVKCLKIACTTIDTSTAATVRYYTKYHIEGQDIAHAGFGQAGVRYMTLSFWHKHTKTGTHSFGVVSPPSDQQYVAEYTQTTSDTWEKATHTFPVATAGTWATDTGNGLTLYFATHIGSNYQGTANTWGSGQAYGTANQVNNFDSTSNSMRFTGVQLEVGSTATDFEHRSYGEELALCQRFYQVIEPGGNLYAAVSVGDHPRLHYAFTTTMRSSPTIVFTGTDAAYWDTTYSSSSMVSSYASTTSNKVVPTVKADAEL